MLADEPFFFGFFITNYFAPIIERFFGSVCYCQICMNCWPQGNLKQFSTAKYRLLFEFTIYWHFSRHISLQNGTVFHYNTQTPATNIRFLVLLLYFFALFPLKRIKGHIHKILFCFFQQQPFFLTLLRRNVYIYLYIER